MEQSINVFYPPSRLVRAQKRCSSEAAPHAWQSSPSNKEESFGTLPAADAADATMMIVSFQGFPRRRRWHFPSAGDSRTEEKGR